MTNIQDLELTEETRQTAQPPKVLTIRITPELHDRLLTYKFLTKKSINELATQLLTDYLNGPGADEMVEASGRRTQTQYRIALDKLGE